MASVIRIGAYLDDKVSSGLAKMRGQFDTLGKSKGFKSVAQGVGIGAGISAWGALGAGVSGVADIIGNSIEAASNLSETMSKSNVVFGSSAKAISAWGDTTADSFGLSKRAAVEAAATFGNFFTGVGRGQEEAADMSRKLVELAGDLASFNNLDPTDALEKLRSGLAGEAEPLRAVGVFLSETKVKAKAAELGLGGLHGELSEGDKILARYQLILDETTTAQGDFARTADGMANTQRRLNAQIEDTEAKLGEQLLPVELAWLNIQKDTLGLLGDGIIVLNNYGKAIDGTADEQQQFYQSTKGLADSLLYQLVPGLSTSGMALRAMSDQGLKYAQAETMELERENSRLAQTLSQMGRATDVVVAASDSYSVALRRNEKDLRLVDKGVQNAIDSLDEISDKLYGKEQRTGALAQAKLDVQDAKKSYTDAVKEFKKDHKISYRETLKLDVLKGNLADARADVLKFTGEAAKAGDKPAKEDLLAYFAKVKIAGDKALDGFLSDQSQIGTPGAKVIKPQIKPKKPKGKLASGGPADAGGVYLVGESGPELLVMGNQGGNVIPNNKLGGGGASAFIAHVYIDGREVAKAQSRVEGYEARVQPRLA